MEKCAFFVKKRGRQCRMTVAKGSIYCGEHLIYSEQSATSSARKRIPCPLDPSHSIYEDNLKKHLKKCNASPHKKPLPFCYSSNINSGLLDYQPSPEESLPLSSFPEEKIQEITQRVEQAYQDHFVELKMQVLSHPALDQELTNPMNGLSALKHLTQQSSILGHLESLSLLTSDNTCFVEFGAGRGKLSECIQKCFGETQSKVCAKLTAETDKHNIMIQDVTLGGGEGETDLEHHDECTPPEKRPRYETTKTSASNVHFVLIDRASCRRKVDGSNKTANLEGIHYHRLLMDIEHLDLSKVECLRDANVESIVAVSKHLCGAATDLSLRCLVNMLSRNHKCTEGTGKEQSKLKGVLVALCCHHRCSWVSLAGREFFEKLGFSSLDFHLVCHMSSWAVCGVRPPAKRDNETTPTTDTKDDATNSASHTCTEKLLSLKKGHEIASVSPSGGKMTENATKIETETVSKFEPLTNQHHLSVDTSEYTKESSEGGSKRSSRWGYVAHPNESIGLKCKRLIDLARLSYLKENGFDARLVYYVERTTSLENVLLIAIPK